MIDADIDYLVLGCSHYPYLIPQIKSFQTISKSLIQAKLSQNKPRVFYKKSQDYNRKNSRPAFYTNANPKVLREILENKYDVIERTFKVNNLLVLNQLEYIT
jgi:glutamate racemase